MGQIFIFPPSAGELKKKKYSRSVGIYFCTNQEKRQKVSQLFLTMLYLGHPPPNPPVWALGKRSLASKKRRKKVVLPRVNYD